MKLQRHREREKRDRDGKRRENGKQERKKDLKQNKALYQGGFSVTRF